MQQLNFFETAEYVKASLIDCEHESGFSTQAYVPGGIFCTECNMVVMRYLPPTKNQPDEIGYISANWAWKYRDGKSWTFDYD